MKVTVTPICQHPDGFSDHGASYTGSHLVVSGWGVWVNGVIVIQRDRRAIRNREPGHPWLTEGTGPWTGFRVEVEP